MQKFQIVFFKKIVFSLLVKTRKLIKIFKNVSNKVMCTFQFYGSTLVQIGTLLPSSSQLQKKKKKI